MEIPEAAVKAVAQLHHEMAEWPERYPTDSQWQARMLLHVALPALKRAWWEELQATKGRPPIERISNDLVPNSIQRKDIQPGPALD